LFTGLYKILEKDIGKVIIQLGDKTHPIFEAHFPGYPILPGFCQIDIISEILEEKVVYINRSKFISHIEPNDIITFLITQNKNKRKIKTFKGNNKVSEIIYEAV